MSINKKIIVAAALGLTFGVSSCKKFLDVNQNPNGATAATVQTLLPGAELYVGTAQGVDLEIDGSFFAQYWTQNPGASQYHNLDQYAPGQDGFSTPWTNLYSAAENFFQLYKLADSQKKKQYMAISLIMQAYTFQLITDGWGDVPCTQALKGQYADGHFVNPKYDSQMVVYNTIIADLDSANKLINPADPSVPGSDDLIYSGNMTKWQKFSNTLMLRTYMRMSQIAPSTAAAGITALYATSPAFIGPGDDAFISYGSSSANKNPLYAEEVGLGSVQNLVGSKSCIDSMNSNGDPRAYIFYEVASAVGSIAGIPQGLYTTTPAAGTVSIPSIYVGGDAQNSGKTNNFNSANAPVNFLTGAESLFLQAEAVARGWAAGNDDSLFYAGIGASFSYYDKQIHDGYYTQISATGDTALTGPTGGAYQDYITGALNGAPGYWTVYPTSGSVAQKVQFIITQKYFAMCGNQGFEAWTELRRTGYPDWVENNISLSSIIGNVQPKRFTYPSSESTVNSSYPGLVPLTTKVWWDLL